jgi:hypothetical protein
MIQAQRMTRAILVAPKSCASNTTTTANLDCQGSDYATIEIALAAELNTNATGPTISLLEADDTNATSFATFSASFERTAEDCTATKVVVYHVNLKPRKRYLRLSFTTPNSSNDVILMGAVSNLEKQIAPISTSQMGDVVVIG